METPLPPLREEDSVVDDADAIALVVVVVVVDAIKTTRKANLEKERFHHRGCSYRMAIIERSLNVLCFAVEHFEFMGYLAYTFSAQQGLMDRREFHRFMIFQINQNRRLQAQFFPIFVQEAGIDMATAQFQLLVTGGGGLLPDRGQLFEVKTQWQRMGGDWMLSKADWEAVRLIDRLDRGKQTKS